MKQINLIIEHCGECPYHEYDSNYGMSYNSGYDCGLSGDRIADDVGSTISDLSSLPIPEWCKLKNVDKILIDRKNKIKKIINKI